MDLSKIVRLVAVIAALALPFAGLEQGPMIIAVLGLIGGWFIDEAYASRFLIGAIALGVSHQTLEPIYGVGEHLTTALGGLSALFFAGACTVIVMGVVNRLKP